jgi:pimeloyl-ACP methyl ester carboxylesterase
VSHLEVEANGLRFHVAECGEGDRLALCLHGFPELWLSWRHQLPLLSRLGYRVWAPDLRGYGDSERPPRMRDYDLEILMRDVAGLIDAAAPRQTLLLAHDWGGVIAWYFAMRRLRPLARLAIFNIPHPEAARPALRTFAQLRRSWYVFFFQLPWLPEWLLGRGRARPVVEMFRRTCSHPERFPREVLEAYREAAARPGALRAMIHYYRMLLRGPGGRRQRRMPPEPIETPTLMVWGEEDVALTLATTRGTDRWVHDLTLRYLPGVSHWVQQDAPETVNAMLEAWLEGRPVPQACERAPAGEVAAP